MIIDSHAHVVLGKADYEKMAKLAGSRNNPKMGTKLPADEISRPVAEGLIAKMDEVGTDVQFISPRPYLQMHSLSPRDVPLFWTRYCNDLIHQHCQMFPDRLKAVAGLPQYRDTSPANCVEELERCVEDLGFIGCILNPDPMEGDGVPPPGLGDPFWYPLYEKLVELDVPALIHSAGCCHPRESYTLKFINEGSVAVMSLLQSDVFKDFPTLKIVISHGGGAIPYQIGRFRAGAWRRGREFDEELRQLYFDTCLYSEEGLELLFKIVGPDNCMFGTERPGTGSVKSPHWGHDLDDLKPVIERIDFLSAEDKAKIFEGTARKVYTKAFG
ncbi:amidohydrolase family protein [Parasphingopyxis marina]|uniref:Amidohydrolase n=1 Tax=Parasphingopyxis marina TaxID=2761622 RepID=A0A842HX99_9SPHN|nr:amidohydrolase family protein [Parasphingopyxis marina]MBC2777047.1 amidohydrolase [Parasphingopyxis marina]